MGCKIEAIFTYYGEQLIRTWLMFLLMQLTSAFDTSCMWKINISEMGLSSTISSLHIILNFQCWQVNKCVDQYQYHINCDCIKSILNTIQAGVSPALYAAMHITGAVTYCSWLTLSLLKIRGVAIYRHKSCTG